MGKGTDQEHNIDDAVARAPFPVFRDDDNSTEHQGKPIIDRTQPPDEAQAITIPNQEAQVVPRPVRAEVVRPVVQPARRGHGAAQVGHGQPDHEDAPAGEEPRPDHAGRAGRKGEGQGAGDGREEAHDGEGDAEDLERGEVALELLPVAHLGQQLGVGLARQDHAVVPRGGEVWVVGGRLCRGGVRGGHLLGG